jgi:carbon-monoxide dehydrogenase large subunit
VEDGRFLARAGKYVDDVQPQGLLHLAFARSPYPRARVVRINVQGARAVPGVVSITELDLPFTTDRVWQAIQTATR